MSDREKEFKKFKLSCNNLCKDATAALLCSLTTTTTTTTKPTTATMATTTSHPVTPPSHNLTTDSAVVSSILDTAAASLHHQSLIRQTLLTLSSTMGESYRSFPLLCSRTPQRFNVPTEVAVATEQLPLPTNADVKLLDKKKKKKKKKKQKPPLPAWKRELQERRGLRKSEPVLAVTNTEARVGETKSAMKRATPGTPGTPGTASLADSTTSTSVCRRTVAVSYNYKTHKVRWGVSGQLKNQKIHKSIWGKSLIKGRPRGTCAEFHVVNEALLAEEAVEDMCLFVSDLVEGSTKPRCRNCLYISSNAQCFSDDLVFDGNTEKQSKFVWSGEGVTFKKT